jgi:hypothetical protein
MTYLTLIVVVVLSAFYKKTCVSVQSSGEATPGTQKVSLAPQQFLYSEYSDLRPGIITAKPFIGSVVSHQFRLKKQSHEGDILRLPAKIEYRPTQRH